MFAMEIYLGWSAGSWAPWSRAKLSQWPRWDPSRWESTARTSETGNEPWWTQPWTSRPDSWLLEPWSHNMLTVCQWVFWGDYGLYKIWVSFFVCIWLRETTQYSFCSPLTKLFLQCGAWHFEIQTMECFSWNNDHGYLRWFLSCAENLFLRICFSQSFPEHTTLLLTIVTVLSNRSLGLIPSTWKDFWANSTKLKAQ